MRASATVASAGCLNNFRATSDESASDPDHAANVIRIVVSEDASDDTASQSLNAMGNPIQRIED